MPEVGYLRKQRRPEPRPTRRSDCRRFRREKLLAPAVAYMDVVDGSREQSKGRQMHTVSGDVRRDDQSGLQTSERDGKLKVEVAGTRVTRHAL